MKEYIELVTELNGEVDEVIKDMNLDTTFSVMSTGCETLIMFGDNIIWSSENDEREYKDEEEREYEDLKIFLLKEVRKYYDKLGLILNHFMKTENIDEH